MGARLDRFPLFPLGLVLLPGEVVPLHIFEERYKLLIGDCLDSEREFGIVWMADDGLREVGCTARVTELLERMDDGRMNILVQGGAPFRLLKRIDDMAYPAGEVELLEDEHGESGMAGPDARERYGDLVERATDSRPADADLEGLSAYAMASTVEFELDAKQALLELRSEEERLERLSDLFERAVKRLEHSERVAERARGNGKVQL